MGIEVPHDDDIILIGAEQGVEVGHVPCWAAGDWGDVDVDDVELNVINYEGLGSLNGTTIHQYLRNVCRNIALLKSFNVATSKELNSQSF